MAGLEYGLRILICGGNELRSGCRLVWVFGTFVRTLSIPLSAKFSTSHPYVLSTSGKACQPHHQGAAKNTGEIPTLYLLLKQYNNNYHSSELTILPLLSIC